jgi:hypothetical protein
VEELADGLGVGQLGGTHAELIRTAARRTAHPCDSGSRRLLSRGAREAGFERAALTREKLPRAFWAAIAADDHRGVF